METESNSFTLNNAKLKFVSSKEQYGSVVYYFVADHLKTREALTSLIDTNQNMKMPMFLTDTDDIMVKVKEKMIGQGSNDLILKQKYKCNLNFEHYTFNDTNGYYIKVDGMQPTTYNTSPEKHKIINITN